MNGSKVYDNLSVKLREKESEFTTAQNALSDTENRMRESKQTKEQLLLELAQHYLPKLVDGNVVTAVSDVNHTLTQILQDKKIRVGFLEEQLTGIAGRRTVLDGRIRTLSEEIDGKSEIYTQKEQEARAQLEATPEYILLVSRAEKTNALIGRLQTLEKGANKEAQEKRPLFESNPVFMYLWTRNFSTPAQQGNFLTNFLDSLTARAINFEKARKSYMHLREYTPSLSQKITREKDGLEQTTENMQKIEEKIYGSTGATSLRQDLEGLSKRRKSLISDNAKFGQEYSQFHEELRGLQESSGIYYTKAIETIKKALHGETEESLMARAKKTPSPEDDAIVKEVIKLNGEISKYQTAIKKQETEATRLNNELNKMRELKGEFERHDWHRSRSRFDSDFDLDTLIVGYLIGRASLSDVTRSMDSSQHFESDSYSSSSYHSSGSSGGGFDSGGGGFGGGFGGGGGGIGGGF